MLEDIELCVATRAHRDELRAMQAISMATLASPYYEQNVIEDFIAMGTMDDTLLEDGTYFIALWRDKIVGSGGWSIRTPGYAARETGASSTGRQRPTVRSVFVHPCASGRGIARSLMNRIEAEMAAAGHTEAQLAATLSGIPFYRRLGWRSNLPITLTLPSGSIFVALGMTKSLASGREPQRRAA